MCSKCMRRRKWAGVPSLAGYTLAYATMATAQGPASVWGAGVLMGMSNGLTAGFLQVRTVVTKYVARATRLYNTARGRLGVARYTVL